MFDSSVNWSGTLRNTPQAIPNDWELRKTITFHQLTTLGFASAAKMHWLWRAELHVCVSVGAGVDNLIIMKAKWTSLFVQSFWKKIYKKKMNHYFLFYFLEGKTIMQRLFRYIFVSFEIQLLRTFFPKDKKSWRSSTLESLIIPSPFSEGTKRDAISIFDDCLNAQDEPPSARRLLGRWRCVATSSPMAKHFREIHRQPKLSV